MLNSHALLIVMRRYCSILELSGMNVSFRILISLVSQFLTTDIESPIVAISLGEVQLETWSF